MKYTVKDLEDQKLIIFPSIMGSQAYGTSLPTSDTDIRGVFKIFLDLDMLNKLQIKRTILFFMKSKDFFNLYNKITQISLNY